MIRGIFKQFYIFISTMIISFICFLLKDIEIFKLLSYILVGLLVLLLSKKNPISILIIIMSLYLSNYVDSFLILYCYCLLIVIFNYIVNCNINRINRFNKLFDVYSVIGKKTESLVSINKIKKGDIVIIKPDSIIPFDGVVIEGKGTVDEGYIYGKEIIKNIRKNSHVNSGTLNKESFLKLRVNTRYKDTKLYRIYNILFSSINSKSKFESNINIIIYLLSSLMVFLYVILYLLGFNYYLFYVLVLIFILLLYKVYLKYVIDYNLIKVFNNGIYVNNRDSFFYLSNVSNIYLDKTGVITTGKLKISKIIGDDKDKILYYLYLGESKLENPIARVINDYVNLDVDNIKIKNYRMFPGRGIGYSVLRDNVLIGNYYFMRDNNIEVERINHVGTILYVVVNRKLIGAIIISDTIKKVVRKNVLKLNSLGIKNITLLSGDNERVVGAICNEIGILDYYSNLIKDEKSFWYNYLIKKYKGNSLYISNYNYKDSSIITDFNCSIANYDLDIRGYDIISSDDDIASIVDVFKVCYSFKNLLIKSLICLLIIIILNIIMMILGIKFVFLNIIVIMILFVMMLFISKGK